MYNGSGTFSCPDQLQRGHNYSRTTIPACMLRQIAIQFPGANQFTSYNNIYIVPDRTELAFKTVGYIKDDKQSLINCLKLWHNTCMCRFSQSLRATLNPQNRGECLHSPRFCGFKVGPVRYSDKYNNKRYL